MFRHPEDAAAVINEYIDRSMTKMRQTPRQHPIVGKAFYAEVAAQQRDELEHANTAQALPNIWEALAVMMSPSKPSIHVNGKPYEPEPEGSYMTRPKML
jgi:hypothetical protein